MAGLILAGLGGLALVAWVLGWSASPGMPEAQVSPTPPAASQQAVTPLPGVESLGLDPRKVALGRRLFMDTRLSRDDTISCATCHRLDQAGVDGLPVSVGIQGRRSMMNTPTVLNSGFNFRQFWDGRAATLEEQVPGPIHNPVEMATTWPEVLAKLNRDGDYPAAFKAIWPQGMKAEYIQQALAEFERSLVTPHAPFDRFLGGEARALDAQARRGWDLFSSLGCIACHQGVNLGGNLFAHLGVMGDYFRDRGRAITKEDLGRYNVTGREGDRHVFKVPSLRNVARTAPYFHDGSVAELGDAVEAMARYQLGVHLADAERQDLVAFLHSLNGELPKGGP